MGYTEADLAKTCLGCKWAEHRGWHPMVIRCTNEHSKVDRVRLTVSRACKRKEEAKDQNKEVG